VVKRRELEGKVSQLEYELWLKWQKKSNAEWSASLPDDGFVDEKLTGDSLGKIYRTEQPVKIGASSLDECDE
jgi:hypothetical protein